MLHSFLVVYAKLPVYKVHLALGCSSSGHFKFALALVLQDAGWNSSPHGNVWISLWLMTHRHILPPNSKVETFKEIAGHWSSESLLSYSWKGHMLKMMNLLSWSDEIIFGYIVPFRHASGVITGTQSAFSVPSQYYLQVVKHDESMELGCWCQIRIFPSELGYSSSFIVANSG